MPIPLTKEQAKEALASIQQFFSREMESDISDLKAKFLLEYFMKEIAPIAYNKGVEDAEAYFRTRLEELKGNCWEESMTYWRKKKKSEDS